MRIFDIGSGTPRVPSTAGHPFYFSRRAVTNVAVDKDVVLQSSAIILPRDGSLHLFNGEHDTGALLPFGGVAVLRAGAVLSGSGVNVLSVPVMADIPRCVLSMPCPEGEPYSVDSGILGARIADMPHRYVVYEQRLFPGQVYAMRNAPVHRTILIVHGVTLAVLPKLDEAVVGDLLAVMEAPHPVRREEVFVKGVPPADALHMAMSQRAGTIDAIPRPGEHDSEFHYLEPMGAGAALSLLPEEGCYLACSPSMGGVTMIVVETFP